MPTAEFKTAASCPSVPSRESAEVVVAEVSSYLSYCDQSDTFGYHGRVTEVEVAPSNDSVVFYWSAPVASEQDIQQVNDEIEQLSHVRLHECLTNPNL